MKLRRLSGVKPTGKIHIGNYFGAIRQHTIDQDKHENLYFVADYHALTMLPNSKQLEEDSLEIVLNYLALGLDPKHSHIFLQSSIPEHTELCWILSNLTPFGLLSRAHAFKDRQAKGEDVNIGLFTYPVLMAADILIYDSQRVPVGRDQKQHVEIARDIAIKFNAQYGETFVLPEPEIVEESMTIAGTDGQKMSKSYNNTIEMFGTEESIKKAVMSIKTDSKGVNDVKNPDTCNIFNIYKLFVDKQGEEQLRTRYSSPLSYAELKKELFARIIEFRKPFYDKRKYLENNMHIVHDILKTSSTYVRSIAQKKISEVRKKVGLLPTF